MTKAKNKRVSLYALPIVALVSLGMLGDWFTNQARADTLASSSSQVEIFPSNLDTQESAQSATGLRIHFSENNEMLTPEHLTLAATLNGQDGFSVLTPMMVHLPNCHISQQSFLATAIEEGTLSSNAASLYDASTGQRLALDVNITDNNGACLITAFAEQALKTNQQYVFTLEQGINQYISYQAAPAVATPAEPTIGIVDIEDEEYGEPPVRQNPYEEQLTSALLSLGYQPEQVVAATLFTTTSARQAQQAEQALEERMLQAYYGNARLGDLSIAEVHKPGYNIQAFAMGTFTGPAESGEAIDFLLALPKAQGNRSNAANIVITDMARRDFEKVAHENALNGYATLYIQPASEKALPRNMEALLRMMNTERDITSLQSGIQGYLLNRASTLSFAKNQLAQLNRLAQEHDFAPLNTNHITYQCLESAKLTGMGCHRFIEVADKHAWGLSEVWFNNTGLDITHSLVASKNWRAIDYKLVKNTQQRDAQKSSYFSRNQTAISIGHYLADLTTAPSIHVSGNSNMNTPIYISQAIHYVPYGKLSAKRLATFQHIEMLNTNSENQRSHKPSPLKSINNRN